MKRVLTIIAVVAFTFAASAQERTRESVAEGY
jgi:hypothetical protein